MEFLVFLREITTWYVFLPLVVGVFRFRHLSNMQVYILYVVILTVFNDMLNIVLRVNSLSNLWTLHFYVPVLFLFVWRIYRGELNRVLSPIGAKILLGVFLLGCLINSFVFQGLNEWPSNMIFLESIAFVVFAVIYFYSLLKRTRLEPLEKIPLFWFNSGALLYYSSAFLLFLLVLNFISVELDSMSIAFGFNAIFNLVLLTSYSISLWVKPLK